MALAAPKLAIEPMPDGWIRVQDAAPRLQMSERHLRRLCEEIYRAAGLAKKHAGSWIIARAADPRLAELDTWEGRDLRQEGELLKEGCKKSAIDRACRLRALIQEYFKFRGVSRREADLCREFLNKCIRDDTFKARGIKAYKPDTWRKLCGAYRKHGLRALVRKPYADRGRRLPGARALAYFLQVIGVGHGITVTDAVKDLQGYVLQNKLSEDPEWHVPSVATMQKWYRQNVPRAGRVLIAEGPRKMRAKCIPKIQRDPLLDYAAGELLVLDERTFDCNVRELGERGWFAYRPRLTAFRDAVSGMIVGWHVGRRANTDTIIAALRMAILTTGTVPREAIFDNGPSEKAVGLGSRKRRRFEKFDGKRIETVCDRLAIVVHFAGAFCPWAKSVESTFNALKTFDRFQLSFTGGSPVAKPEDLTKWTKENILALPTIDSFREQFSAYLDAYHEEPRRSSVATGLCPRQALETLRTENPRKIDGDTLDVLCRTLVGPVKVQRDGVRHEKLQFGTWDEAVFKLQGEKVWLAVDPIDRDSVLLCHADGTPICTAHVAAPMGYKSEEVREAIAFQRRCERAVKQYAPSRDYLLKTTPQQIAERRKLAAQARQIPDKHLPPRPAAVSVELVRPDVAEAAERVKRAAGAEAMRRLAGTNAAADAVNASRRRRVDFARFAGANDSAADDAEPTARRCVDWSKLSKESVDERTD